MVDRGASTVLGGVGGIDADGNPHASLNHHSKGAVITRRRVGRCRRAPGTGGPNRVTYWLATSNADGTPHLAAVGTLPIDGVLCVISGLGTRKSRNLARDSRCVVTVSMQQFDLVVEGSARIVTDRTRLERIAQAYADQGWPAQVNDDGTALTAPYSAPSAGPPPWHAYEVTPTKVIAVGGEPGARPRSTSDASAGPAARQPVCVTPSTCRGTAAGCAPRP